MLFTVKQLKSADQAYTNSTYSNLSCDFVKIKDKIYKNIYTPDPQNNIGINAEQRKTLGLNINEEVNIEIVESVPNQNKLIIFDVQFGKKSFNKVYFKKEIKTLIRTGLRNIPIQDNQRYVLLLDEIPLFISTKHRLSPVILSEYKISIESQSIKFKTKKIFKRNINLTDLGIGGLNNEFNILFRQSLMSRNLSEEIINKLGIKHSRGVLLYGPPGCGKTLMARKLAEVINCNDIVIVNGPELLNAYVGKSEENIRNLFSNVEDGQLRLIICDEFDALSRKRGNSGSLSVVGDNLVNQFLAMIDGVNASNNTILFCLTNRIELIDPALLRPGRLYPQLEIGLPTRDGRKEIFEIYIRKIAENYIKDNINLDELADLTPNFTGAEIESVVNNAISIAVHRECSYNSKVNEENIKIKYSDILRAIKDTKQMFPLIPDSIKNIGAKHKITNITVHPDLREVLEINAEKRIKIFDLHSVDFTYQFNLPDYDILIINNADILIRWANHQINNLTQYFEIKKCLDNYFDREIAVIFITNKPEIRKLFT